MGVCRLAGLGADACHDVKPIVGAASWGCTRSVRLPARPSSASQRRSLRSPVNLRAQAIRAESRTSGVMPAAPRPPCMDSFGTLQRERIAQILCAPAGQVGLVHLNSLNIDDFANPPDKTPGGEAQTRASAGASLNRAALFRFCDDYKTLGLHKHEPVGESLPA